MTVAPGFEILFGARSGCFLAPLKVKACRFGQRVLSVIYRICMETGQCGAEIVQ